MAAIALQELHDAYTYISAGSFLQACAYWDRETGAVHFKAGDIEADVNMPEDLEDNDRYVQLPGQQALRLGRNLALSFAETQLPDEFDKVAAIFHRKGAYGRFKELLASRDVLEKWYDYEKQAVETALRQWCEDREIEVADE